MTKELDLNKITKKSEGFRRNEFELRKRCQNEKYFKRQEELYNEFDKEVIKVTVNGVEYFRGTIAEWLEEYEDDEILCDLAYRCYIEGQCKSVDGTMKFKRLGFIDSFGDLIKAKSVSLDVNVTLNLRK